MPTPEALADDALARWLTRRGHPPEAFTPLAGDVSARRYLRVESAGRSAVVATYPRSLRDACRRFRQTGKLLAEVAGVRVPAVLASDCGRGWMLLEDLGDRTLYDRRHEPWTALRGALEEAIVAAGRIARLPASRVAELSPPLDAALLERELDQTWRAYLVPNGLTGDRRVAAALRTAFGELCSRLGGGSPVPCHRDFMARNLMILDDGGLAVVDHQDLRMGPRHYDLASLVNDSLFPPATLTHELLGSVATAPSYRRAAAQRALKAVGTFAVFAARGDPRHLGLIPPTLGRALDHLLRLPETAAAVEPLAERWRAIC